jgi:hypothetical protein
MAERLNLTVESRRDRKRLDGESMSQRESVESQKAIEATLAAAQGHHGIGGMRLGLATCALTLVLGLGGYAAFHRDADLEATAGAACVSYRDSVVSVAADCRAPVELARGHDVINVKPGTVLSESKAGIRVRHGEAVFFVHKREPGEVFRVLVSHGTIEVVGTEFYVKQGEAGGTVHLANGRIIFHDDDGKITYMQPGDDLTWPHGQVETPPPAAIPIPMPTPIPVEEKAVTKPQPRAHVGVPAPKPAKAPAEPKPAPEAKEETIVAPEAPPKPPRVEAADDEDEKPAPEPEEEKPLSMEEVLKKMNQLRSQHRYSDAATLLRQQIMRDDFTKQQRARLSYELGIMLQDRLDDRVSACRHWHEHQMIFPNDTEHGEQVQKALDACDGNAK